MTDTVKAWIEERRAIHAAATPGEWNEAAVKFESGDIAYEVGTDHDEETAICRTPRSPQAADDHHAIVDAHNMFPRTLDAMNAVLQVLDSEQPPDPCQPDDPFGMCEDCRLIRKIRQAIEGAIGDD